MSSSIKKSILQILGLLIIGISSIGCSKPGGSAQKSVDVLETPLQTAILTFDPTWVTDLYTHRVLMQVFEGLVTLAEDNTPQPALAENIERSEDGKVYTFHIRKGVKFHNGKELTADDVKFSFERACDPKLTSPSAESFFNDIVGALDKIKGEGKVKEISGIKVLDKYKVQITLNAPKVYFLAKMAYTAAYICPKGTPLTQITKKEDVIGTGPYKFTNYVKDQVVVLDANNNYWGEKPKIAKIKFEIVKDQLISLNQYKAGKYQFCFVTPLEIPKLRKDTEFNKQLQFKDHASSYYLELNPKVYSPFKNAKVRQAIAMAIDKKYIAKYTANESVEAANGVIGQGIPGYRENTACLPYDPIAAKKLLTEAGYSDGSKLPPLELTVSGKAGLGIPVSETVVIQLKKNLGIRASVKQLDWTTYIEKHNKGEIAFRFAGWSADYFDPANFLSDLFMTNAGANHCAYSNPKFDALCAKADGLSDPQERMKLYGQAEDVLLQDGQVIPIMYPRDTWLIRTNVEGLRFNLSGPMSFNTVTIKANK